MFLYHKWLELSLPTRNKLAEIFGIVKKGPTEVFNNTIKSDGYVIKEIEEALNIDAIQKFVETEETDMQKIWTMLVDKIEGREVKMNEPTHLTHNLNGPTVVTEKIEEVVAPKKRGRQSKKD